MEVLSLVPWTLGARLEGESLEFNLGDGRRAAWRSVRPAALLRAARSPMAAADLLGEDLAGRLARSEPRVLNLQFEDALDAIAWEALGLGATTLAEHFAIGRQVLAATEHEPVPAAGLAESLAVCVLDATADAEARSRVARAHVVVLDDAPLAQVLERAGTVRREHLVVLPVPVPARELGAPLDHGAAVLVANEPGALKQEAVDALLSQLASGASVGEAVRSLHRRAAPGRLGARLYGDPAIRFVRVQTPTSLRQVTSLSFDLAGSTTLMHELGSEAYAEMLVRLYALGRDVVRRHGGRPDEYRGDDGFMCYFGHPQALEGAPERAVAAGLEIVRSVAGLGLAARVGIATGEVAIKSDQPVGPSIHLAARLQTATEPGAVLASAEVRDAVVHAFEVQPLAQLLYLKGMPMPVQAFRVIRPDPQAKAHRLDRAPSLTPFVGRRDELDRLDHAFRRTHAGRNQVVEVRGDAGMGKSRLVREFRHRLTTAGVRVLEVRCRTEASASPYLALTESLRRWLDIGPDETPGDGVRKLAAALPPDAREGEPLALLAAFLGLAQQPAQASPAVARQRLQALLIAWLRGFAQDKPSCLVVEDWHWADPSLRELVEALIAQHDGPGQLVVVTSRDEAGSAPPAAAAFECIELAGLEPEAARELVASVAVRTALPPGLVRLLADRGDGVPLFLEEATRMALARGGDRFGAGFEALEAVPGSLHELLTARLDTLGRSKRVAQVAAVVGREFSAPLLASLLETDGFEMDAATVGERLAELVDSGLVRAQGGGRYVFKHALIRDAAYASLWTSQRRALHARVVALLQERWPELAAAQPELLALHQTEAGLYPEALKQWELAASNAAGRSADLEAISHLRHAIGVLGRLEPGAARDRTALRLQLLLAARLLTTEGYGAESVLHAYLEAQRLCDRMGDETARFKVEMGIEAYRFMRADFGPALEHGQRAAEIAARSGDAKQRLQAHWGLACTLFHQGELRATMREMDKGLALYTPAMHRLFGVQDPGIMCMAYSSWGLWELGRPDAALARINEAAAIARACEHKFSQAVALAYGVSVELLRGEMDAAMVRAEACIRVCEESGFPVWLAITRCMRGRVLCEKGAIDLGLAEMRDGLALWLSTGALVSQPLYLSLQAEGLMLAGQTDAAAKCVDEGLAIIERFGERQLQAEMLRLRGELEWARGDVAKAEWTLKAAYACAIRWHKLGFALRSATSLARLWAGDGRAERARRLLVPLVARWKEGRGTRDVRAALEVCKLLED
ncbi:MAG: AAA family ATPase [Burkholderiales bacterium]|nr:AAA family ATPase [Burkholderiales bacterium]